MNKERKKEMSYIRGVSLLVRTDRGPIVIREFSLKNLLIYKGTAFINVKFCVEINSGFFSETVDKISLYHKSHHPVPTPSLPRKSLGRSGCSKSVVSGKCSVSVGN